MARAPMLLLRLGQPAGAAAAAAAAHPSVAAVHPGGVAAAHPGGVAAEHPGGVAAWGIFEQLQLEEALMRSDNRNWCIMNRGADPATIVMGISGVPDKLIHTDAARAAGVRTIRRFSGGGTVITDADTFFISFICNMADVPTAPRYPRAIMKWTADDVYGPVFARLAPAAPFSLTDVDYCLGDRKFGGNAQAISRERWVHHTSFLWRMTPATMALLKQPDKAPAYRAAREHADFLTPLAAHVRAAGGGPHTVWDAVEARLRDLFDVTPATLHDAADVLARPQERRSNSWVAC